MTMTDPAYEREDVSDPTWREVEPGFWVGGEDGTFLGTIESHGERFFARDAVRSYLGEYTSLEAARDAIDHSRARRA